eukprot:CAMPEP_0181317408 /NCGR_PEP_ID=MMETSP1101-20121128/16451_1 /TAXON_ID=46948 /ORGANISM="Rhodomonas abbreviata, Strain Caron Lab Isolate" /LENGTH=262 /DNA_ID=CAMNT_0023424797 /DNA_START=1 /DNA_END=785 /DNA_ORIENTATION=+
MDWCKVLAMISPPVVFPKDFDGPMKRDACRHRYNSEQLRNKKVERLSKNDAEDEDEGEDREFEERSGGDKHIRMRWTPEEEAALLEAARQPSCLKGNGLPDWDKVLATMSPPPVFPASWGIQQKRDCCRHTHRHRVLAQQNGARDQNEVTNKRTKHQDEAEQDREDGSGRWRTKTKKFWTPEEEVVLMKAASRPSSKRKNGTMDWDKVFALISPHIVFPEEWDEHTKKEACKGKYHFVKRKEIEEAEMQSEDGEQEEQGRAG